MNNNNNNRAWKVERSSPKLFLQDCPIPTISSNDVLVRVRASSLNPLDLLMRNAYGSQVFDLLDFFTNSEVRISSDRYPLTLGRDFSGEVVALGANVDSCKPGDQVFGCIEPQKSGSQCDFVVANSSMLVSKPGNLSHSQAASIPYSGLTAWSALTTFGGLNKSNCVDKQVLVLGGSGGVGSFAVQLLKSWGALVTTTCSQTKIDWLKNELLVDEVLDYNDSDSMSSLNGQFDFVLDASSQPTLDHHSILKNGLKYLKPYQFSTHVTLNPTLLRTIDTYGLLNGTAKSTLQAIQSTLLGFQSMNQSRAAFFIPNSCALKQIRLELEKGSIKPNVWKNFDFENIEDAYKELQLGAVQGKVVIRN